MTDVSARSYDEEAAFITEASPTKLIVAEGFVPNMRVRGEVYVNERLRALVLGELRAYCESEGARGTGYSPALKQIANVAALPGVVRASVALPLSLIHI